MSYHHGTRGDHQRPLVVPSPPRILLPAPTPMKIPSRALIVVPTGRSPSSSTLPPSGCATLALVILLLVGYTLWSVLAPSPVSKAHTSSRSQEKLIPTVPRATFASSPPPSFAHPVQRIFQLDSAQYNDAYTVNNWGPSTCSTAAITMIMNAYGKHYRLVDVLAVEARIGAITMSEGLLSYQGLSQTVAKFGFTTVWLNHPSPLDVIAYAQLGQPIIVNLHGGPDWPTGHFLLVTGGKANVATTVDSSSLALSQVSLAYLQTYWTGGAALILPAGTPVRTPYQVQGRPTISTSFINSILEQAGSPAAGKGQAIYDLGIKYGIDPAFALAFFQHESTYGTQGEAAKTRSLGNLRCISSRPCIDRDRGGGYAQMTSWEDGFEVWYNLIRTLYVGQWGLTTVDQIIPKYAPSSDNNDEAAYIRSVEEAIFAFRSA